MGYGIVSQRLFQESLGPRQMGKMFRLVALTGMTTAVHGTIPILINTYLPRDRVELGKVDPKDCNGPLKLDTL